VRPALVAFLVLLLIAGCGGTGSGRPAPVVLDPAAADASADGVVTMEVFELLCGPCAAQIVRRSREIEGVTDVRMELATKTLTIRFDPARVGRDRVVAGVEQIVGSIQ
jgi:copper chaperone CopZ